jgi:hypothetical protein
MSRIDLFSSRNPNAVIASGALWLVSVALGGLAVFALRAILMWALALLIPQPDAGSRLETANAINLFQMCGTIAFGVVFVGVIIYVSERFFRDAGKPRFLRTLATIILIEGAIVLPVWWLLWR